MERSSYEALKRRLSEELNAFEEYAMGYHDNAEVSAGNANVLLEELQTARIEISRLRYRQTSGPSNDERVAAVAAAEAEKQRAQPDRRDYREGIRRLKATIDKQDRASDKQREQLMNYGTSFYGNGYNDEPTVEHNLRPMHVQSSPSNCAID